jgi:hypothetical protein
VTETNPRPISDSEWQEIMRFPLVKDAWGLEDGTSPREFAARVYAAKFKFVSGSPSYVGDLYILQGDALTDDGLIVLRRNMDGGLIVSHLFETSAKSENLLPIN